MNDKPRIGITMGDPNGIGPEVIIKVLSDNRILNLITPVVYGSSRVISYYKKALNVEDFSYGPPKGPGQYHHKSVNVINCWDENLEIQPGTASVTTAKAAVTALKKAVEDINAGHLDGIVTGPIDKKTSHSDDFPFQGHTEYLTKAFQATESLMMMVSENLKVGLVTEHVPLKEVPRLLSKERVELKIRLMEFSLKKDFGKQKPRIAVLGFNPHAGDEGLLGDEEEKILKPVIEDLKTKGKLIFGPYAADGFFGTAQFQNFDGVMAMYHDQGLGPFKAIAFDNGVNFTAGLPIVRTSPDHGTAYAITGKGKADEGSMRHAIYLAADIINQRKQIPSG
ncbi:MAG: 4-hydroxythreonine-4-phosphate dehydrogenase PdxA [Bacteroidetes bacterium]|nr:4-hydroxythreonine-4-phosphate dehydrogenase PdxA [Bacteroidota bacterium]